MWENVRFSRSRRQSSIRITITFSDLSISQSLLIRLWEPSEDRTAFRDRCIDSDCLGISTESDSRTRSEPLTLPGAGTITGDSASLDCETGHMRWISQNPPPVRVDLGGSRSRGNSLSRTRDVINYHRKGIGPALKPAMPGQDGDKTPMTAFVDDSEDAYLLSISSYPTLIRQDTHSGTKFH